MNEQHHTQPSSPGPEQELKSPVKLVLLLFVLPLALVIVCEVFHLIPS